MDDELDQRSGFVSAALCEEGVCEDRRDGHEMAVVPHALERVGSGAESTLSRIRSAGEELDLAGLELNSGRGDPQTEFLRERQRSSDQLARDVKPPLHGLEAGAAPEDRNLESPVALQLAAHSLGALESRPDRHGAVQCGEQHVSEALGLLQAVAGTTCMMRRSLEIIDRCRCPACPEAELAGKAESARQPGFVAELLEYTDGTCQLVPDLLMTRHCVRKELEARQRHRRIGRNAPLAGGVRSYGGLH